MVIDLDPRYGALIFENIPHGIFTVGATGRITSFNAAAEQITGYRRDEVIGRRCRDVLRSTHCEGRCFLLNSISGGPPHRDEEVMISRRDGTEVAVAVSTAALHDTDGAVCGGVEMFRDLTELTSLRRHVRGAYICDDIVSKSPAMRAVRDLLPLVARSSSIVLVEGEPGTGKELVARTIHNLGPRRDGPFVAVNCGALPETLIESELFGHVRGAFTDATRDRPGRFALAKGGTLLLDEIGDVSPAVQVKLLRVLQEREFTPLGSTETLKADVRILAATNRDLSHDVMTGRFRQDLYFRLNIVRIALPPLRSRREDIPILVDHFVQRFNALQGRRITAVSERAMACLLAHTYPGNVRELENAIEHAFVVCGGSTIRLEDLPQHLLGNGQAATRYQGPEPDLSPLATAEATAIADSLRRHGGNRTHAAADLGISRNTLWRKMRRYGIQ